MADGATGGEDAVLLLHAAAVVAQDFTFLAQVLRMLLALVGDVQAVGLLQRSLRRETERSDQPAEHARSVAVGGGRGAIQSSADGTGEPDGVVQEPKDLMYVSKLLSGKNSEGSRTSATSPRLSEPFSRLWELEMAELLGDQ